MIHFTHDIHINETSSAQLILYIQNDSQELAIRKRPLVLLCPGGGYSFTTDREAEAMALQYLSIGYHAAVLRYSCAPHRYPTALLELATSILYIRQNADLWNVCSDKIVVEGCSAGGHLAACLGVFWNKDFLADALNLNTEQKDLLKPNGLILCYPVITSGPYAEKGSFENLLGPSWREHCEELSLENQVSSDTPRTFIWHTYEDRIVPVENSLLFVSALRKFNIPAEFHMYEKGGHGLALANHLTEAWNGNGTQEECSSWIPLVNTWLQNH